MRDHLDDGALAFFLLAHRMENEPQVNRAASCTPINPYKWAWTVHRPENFELVDDVGAQKTDGQGYVRIRRTLYTTLALL